MRIQKSLASMDLTVLPALVVRVQDWACRGTSSASVPIWRPRNCPVCTFLLGDMGFPPDSMEGRGPRLFLSSFRTASTRKALVSSKRLLAPNVAGPGFRFSCNTFEQIALLSRLRPSHSRRSLHPTNSEGRGAVSRPS